MKLKFLVGIAALVAQSSVLAAGVATTQAELITKYSIPTTTTTAFSNYITAQLKAGNAVSLSGYGDIAQDTTPTVFYFKTTPVTNGCSINWTTNVETCNLDPTKTEVEYGTKPNYYSLTQIKYANDFATAVGGTEWNNIATKLVPAIVQEMGLNVSGVTLDNIGTFTTKVSTTGKASLSFAGVKKAALP